MSIKLLLDQKRFWAGLILNLVLMVYVYFIVGGGPASIRDGADWLAILNEVPLTILFFMASIIKPYLMVWSKGKKVEGVTSSASTAMLVTTVVACLIVMRTSQEMIQDLVMYINWGFLWSISAYYVLIPQPIPAGD